MEIDFNHWHIEVDVEATRRAYADIIQSDAQECGCSMCRNFIAQRNAAYSPDVLQFFKQVGIDAAKEIHLSCINEAPDRHLYLISHCFIGTVQPDDLLLDFQIQEKCFSEAASNLSKVTDSLERQRLMNELNGFINIDQKASQFFNPSITFLPRNITPKNFPSPTVTVDTSITFPWVLDKNEEPIQ